MHRKFFVVAGLPLMPQFYKATQDDDGEAAIETIQHGPQIQVAVVVHLAVVA